MSLFAEHEFENYVEPNPEEDNKPSQDDLELGAKFYIDYFSDVENIEKHSKKVKLERMGMRKNELGNAIQNEAFTYQGCFFDDYDIHPKDMVFDISCIHDVTEDKENDKRSFKYRVEAFNRGLDIVSSHTNKDSVPGKTLKWVVEEKTTGKIVGFIRFASPLMNSKPRNERLGKVPEMVSFNKHAIMGFVIVPVQPFGYNYAGGKLLTLLCCSHYARKYLNEKYENCNICSFETTSLYGSAKAQSQYDGMKPFIKYYGLTESKMPPFLPDETFNNYYNNIFSKAFEKDPVDKKSSNRLLKRNNYVINYIKKNLEDEKLKNEFISSINKAISMTQKKRFYISDYGFENSREVILGEQTELIPSKQNYHKFELDYMIDWWKNKATNRYEKLKKDGRLRHELELWNSDEINFDIIR